MVSPRIGKAKPAGKYGKKKNPDAPPMDQRKPKVGKGGAITTVKKGGGKVTGPTLRPKNRKMAEVKSDLKKVGRVVGKSLILPYAAVTGNLGPAVKSLYDEAPKMKTGGMVKKKRGGRLY